jgi:hypothetical protein
MKREVSNLNSTDTYDSAESSEVKKANKAATLIMTQYRRYVAYEDFQLMLIRIISIQQLFRKFAAKTLLEQLRLKRRKTGEIHHQHDKRSNQKSHHDEEEKGTNQRHTTKGGIRNVTSTANARSASSEVKEANNRESPMAECPPAATTRKEYTPAHSTMRKRCEVSPGDCTDLMDTPESQLPKMKGDRKLRKNLKENPVIPVPMRSDEPYVDEWTDEEGKKKEFGIERCILKRYGAKKIHVENLQRVMATYPALKEVINHKMNEIDESSNKHPQARAERVAEEIRGVPLSTEPLMEKEDLADWFHGRIFCEQPNIPRDCQYTYLAEHAYSLRDEQKARSTKLYEKKMQEDSKPMEFMQCGAHAKGKDQHCLPLSKLSR